MFGRSGAHEIGYANSAVLIALIRTLVEKQVLTKDQATDVLNDAIETLNPNARVGSIDTAIKMIGSDFKSRVAA